MQEKESFFTTSLPNSPSISLIEGQYKRNEVAKALPAQPSNKPPNESDVGIYSFPRHSGLSGCSGIYEDDWPKNTTKSATSQAENLRSNIEDDRLALMHPKSTGGPSS